MSAEARTLERIRNQDCRVGNPTHVYHYTTTQVRIPTANIFRLLCESIKVSKLPQLLHNFYSLLGGCKTSFIAVISFAYKTKGF